MDRQLERRRRGSGRQRRRDYRMPPIWEYLTPGGDRKRAQAHRRPGQDRPLRRDRPAVHDLSAVPAGAHAAAHARLDQPGHQHLRGVAGGRRLGAATSTATLVATSSELLRLPRPWTARTWRSRAGRSSASCVGDEQACYPQPAAVPGRRQPVPYGALNRDRFTDGGGEYEAPSSTTPPTSTPAADCSATPTTTGSTARRARSSLRRPGDRGVRLRSVHDARSTRSATTSGMSHPHDGFDYQTGLISARPAASTSRGRATSRTRS